MSLETALGKMIDPNGYYRWLKRVEVIYTGRIYNIHAKDIINANRLFLKQGVKIVYEFSISCGYDNSEPDGYEYYEGVAIVYLTPKQYTMLCLMA